MIKRKTPRKTENTLKSTYRIFTKVSFLSIITILLILSTLQFLVVGIFNIAENGVGYFLNENFIGIFFIVIISIFDIWLLTSTFLPVIKINDSGIFSYSIFWKRKIIWTEIQSVKLLKVESRHSTGRQSISFEFTQESERKNALTNKGVRVNTFIIISKKGIKKPKSISLGGQLLNHNKITTIDEIAFEYEQTTWETIKNKLSK